MLLLAPAPSAPTLRSAAAFYAALLLFDHARNADWHPLKLFAAGFLIAYTSGLHYYGCLAFLGAAVYLYGIWKSTLERKRKKLASLALFAGGLAFGLPYLFCFVLPNYHDILTVASYNQGEGGIGTAILKHFGQYADFERIYFYTCGLVVPIYALFFPVWSLKIPLFIISTFGLCLSRRTRFLAIASLPLLLFIFLGSRGKSEGYFLPEMLFYMAGLALLLQTFFHRFFKGNAKHLGALTLLLPVVFQIPFGLLNFVDGLSIPKDNQMHLARACNKQIVGEKALVGGRMSAWYIGGANRWYEVSKDVLSKRDLSNVNLRAYFDRFDAIVETRHLSNLTENAQNQSLPNWYLDGTLQLKGFYLSNDRSFQSELSSLVLSTDSLQNHALLGYGCKYNDNLYRYTVKPDGDHIFATFTKPKNPAHNTDVLAPLIDRMSFMGYMPLPYEANPAPSGEEKFVTELIYFVMPFADFERYKHILPDMAIFKDQIRCSQSLANKKQLLKQLHETDRQITILEKLN